MKSYHAAGVIIAVLCLAGSAFGWPNLISSFTSPCNYPEGLGFLNGELHIAGPEYYIYRTTTTGSVIGSFRSTRWNGGLAAGTINSTDYVWNVGAALLPGPYRVYRRNATTGSIYGSYQVTYPKPYGLAFRDSQTLYYTDSVEKQLYVLDPISGSIRDSHQLDFEPDELAYDPAGYLWIGKWKASTVFKCTTTGSVVTSFSSEIYGSAKGCGFDGTYLWLGITSGSEHRVLQLDVGSEPAVGPASLGRVKALFR